MAIFQLYAGRLEGTFLIYLNHTQLFVWWPTYRIEDSIVGAAKILYSTNSAPIVVITIDGKGNDRLLFANCFIRDRNIIGAKNILHQSLSSI